MVTNRARQKIIWIAPKKSSKSCSDELHHWCFWSAFRHFGTHLAESFRMSKSSSMMEPTRSREMPSCSAIDLAEIRLSSKIISWIWSIISGVVTVLCRSGRGASQVEKSPRINCPRYKFAAILCAVLNKYLSQSLWSKEISSRRSLCSVSCRAM